MRPKRALIAGLVVALILSACAGQTGQPQGSPGQSAGPIDPRLTTLTIGVESEAQSFDPQVNTAIVSAYRFYPNIYESLIQYGSDGSLKPMLAESWTQSADALTVRFKLRSGVKFSDGTPFNAEAVKAAYDRMKTIGKGGIALFGPISSIRVIDDLNVEIVLSQPYPVLAAFASWQSAIFLSPSAVKQNEVSGDLAQGWLKDHTAGTGPFMLETWTPSNRIVMVRNPNYRTPPSASAIQRIVYPLISEPGTMRQQFEVGDIDLVSEVVPALIDPLKRAQNVKVGQETTTGSSFGQWIALNMQTRPFNNKDLRYAVSYAIDYGRLVTVWNGSAERSHGPFPPSFRPWYSATDAMVFNFDPAKAAEHLRKAGYSVPISPALKVNLTWQAGATAQRDMGQLIKEDLAKIGIDVNVQSLELPVWRQQLWGHTFEMTYFQQSHRYADPDAFAGFLMHSREWKTDGSAGTNPGFRDPEIDKLIDAARAETDPQKRRVLYNQLTKIGTEAAPYLFLVDKQHVYAHGTNVAGIEFNPYYGQFWDVSKITKNAVRGR